MPTVLNNIGISGDYGQIVFHNDGTDNIIDLSHSNATTVTHDLSINNTLQAGQILGTKSGKVIELSGNALMVPVGTDNQRPDNASGAVGVGEIGMIRYNTTSSTFEGYGPTAWGSLGGVINTQQKTFVEAIDEHSNHDISSNSIQFTTSGELVAVINANGRVGIGSTNPGHLLDVAGNVRFQDNLYLGTSTDSSNSIQSHAILNLNSNTGETRFYTDGTQKMVLTTGGKLGIGSTEPQQHLDVSGNISVTGQVKSGATFTSSADDTLFQGQTNTHLRAETGQILLVANGSERMRVNLDGHVGIGSNGPTTRLDISNNTVNSVLAVRQHDPAQNIAEFYNGANQLMVIDNSGSLGINRSNVSSNYALDVSGAAIFSKSLRIRDDANPEGAEIVLEAPNNSSRFHIDITEGAHFRIFKTLGVHSLFIDNTTNFIGLNGSTPSVELDISGTGALRIPVGNDSGDRPTGANGMIRYNNTDNRYEGYSGSSWGALGGGGSGTGQVVTNIRTLTQGETLFNIDISANTDAYMPHKVSMSDDGNRVAIADSTVDAGDTTAATVKIYDYNVNNNQYEVKQTITVQRDGADSTVDAEGIRGIHMTGDKNTILVVTANLIGNTPNASDYDGSYTFTPYELTSSDSVTYTPGTPLTIDNAPWYDMDDGTTLMIAKKNATGSNRDVYFYNYSGSNKEFTLSQTIDYATDISNALPAGFDESRTAPKHVAISGDGLRALWVEEDRSNIIVFKRLSTFADFQILQTIQLGSSSMNTHILYPNFDYAGKFMALSMGNTDSENAIKIYAYDETKFNYVLESSFNAINTLTDGNTLGQQVAHVSKDGTRLFVGAKGTTNTAGKANAGAIAMLKLDKQGKVPVSSGTATAEHIIYGLDAGDRLGMGLSTDYNGKRMIGIGAATSDVTNVRVIQTQEESITSSSTFNINEVKSVGGPLLLTPDPAHPNVGIGITDPSGALDVSGTIISRGKIGIGTTSPELPFEVVGNNSISNPNTNNMANAIAKFTANDVAGLVFGSKNGNAPYIADCNGASIQSLGLRFLTQSEERMQIDASGNVGIGTNDPISTLDVSGSTIINHNDRISSNTFVYYPDSGSTYTFRTANSSTGITSTSALTVVSNNSNNNYPDNYTLNLVNNSSGTENNKVVRLGFMARDSTGTYKQGPSINFMSTDLNIVNGILTFNNTKTGANAYGSYGYNKCTPSMAIDNDGNVGIGTTNPSEVLDVSGSIRVRNKGSIFVGDSIVDSLRMHHLTNGDSYIDYNSDKNLYFRRTTDGSGADVLSLDNSGNVGIGITNPTEKLNVDGRIKATGHIKSGATFTSDADTTLFQGKNNTHLRAETGQILLVTNGGERMRIDASGHIGIGTNAPGYGLERRGGSKDNQAFHGDFYIGKDGGYGWKWTYDSNIGGGGITQYYGSQHWWIKRLVYNQTVNYTSAGYFAGASNVDQIDFTGQHRCFVDNIKHNEAVNYRGLIVCADKNDYISIESKPERGNKGIMINESLPLVSLSTKHKDKSCFGVISDSEDPDTRSHSNGSMLTTIFDKEIGDTRIYINSVGEGAIWIIDASGNLESGDYITTSSVPGYGVVQESEFLANYTVAKITMDCDFSPALQPVKIIKKKNLLDSSGNQIYNGSGSITIEKNPDGFEVVNDLSSVTILARKEKDENIFYEQVDNSYTTDASGNKIKLYTVSGTTIIDNSDNIVYDYNGGEATLTNDLDSNGDFQWVDSTVQEYAYNIRYVDAAGTILTESDYITKKAAGEAVYKAAFIGCTYHCG